MINYFIFMMQTALLIIFQCNNANKQSQKNLRFESINKCPSNNYLEYSNFHKFKSVDANILFINTNSHR